MKRNRRLYIYALLVGVWLFFTVSLTSWWVIFGLRQIDELMAVKHEQIGKLVRQQEMLIWEGMAFFVSLLLGGVAIGYFMFREVRQAKRVRNFLATFTHELKTPLASLRLQAEILKEQLAQQPYAALLDRLVSDTGRLTLQLDNSLLLANEQVRELFVEELSLQDVLASLKHHWPDCQVHLDHECVLKVDRRALESILQNLIQNAVTHGKAGEVELQAVRQDSDFVCLIVTDNGCGFNGNTKKLGQLFARFYSASGSGIGLYLARKLAKEMGGDLTIAERHSVQTAKPGGFSVKVTLPGYILQSNGDGRAIVSGG